MVAKVKPPVSQWIIDQRKAHGWKVEELSTRLRGMGYEAEVGTIRVWEAGRVPRADTIDGLERLFGSEAPREQEAASTTAVLVAIERQTEMLEKQWAATTALVQHLGALVGEMQADRKQAHAERRELARLIGLAVPQLPAEMPAEDPPARPARARAQNSGA